VDFLSTIGSGIGSLFSSPSNTVGGSLATTLGVQGVDSFLGKGGGQQRPLQMPGQRPGATPFMQPPLNLGGQGGGMAPSVGTQSQAPQMPQMPQISMPQQQMAQMAAIATAPAMRR